MAETVVVTVSLKCERVITTHNACRNIYSYLGVQAEDMTIVSQIRISLANWDGNSVAWIIAIEEKQEAFEVNKISDRNDLSSKASLP